MYRTAYSQDGDTVFYLDSAGNKYAASGGSLAWRLNNPGLVHSTSRFFSRESSIGHFSRYAIFATPENGREALSNWLHSKKYFNGSLKTIAKHYQSNNPDDFAGRLFKILSKTEAIQWVQQNHLDAIIVHEHNGHIHLRSRPDHWIQHIRFPFATVPQPQDIAPLMRIVGTAKEGQCIWAFINGIDNTKQDALKAANHISSMAGGESEYGSADYSKIS